MIATIVIASITFVLITLSILFFPKMKVGKFSLSTFWIIALLGACTLLIAGLAPIKEVFKQLTTASSVNPLKIIVLFFSMTVISIYLNEVGFFKYLASVAAKKSGKNQFVLFTVFFVLIAILTVFTSNDIIILTFTPFLCFFCKHSKINPIPYLVAEFAAANTWSMMLIIGNPTNIYLATSAGITFFEYFKVMALPTLIAGVIEYALLTLLFIKSLGKPMDFDVEEVRIENKFGLEIGLAHLGICLVLLVLSNYLHFSMWLIALVCATSLVIITTISSIITKKHFNQLTNSIKKLPYELIPFFLSMFVIVVAFNYQGISGKIAGFLGKTEPIWTYGLSSFVVSNLINNIPMSILFSSMCTTKAAVFASIVGSNIGAFLTPIGALAGIMFTNLVAHNDTKYSFIDFIKYGAITSIPVISVALLTLWFVL